MNLIRVTPFLHVGDFEEALRFFTETLGFAVGFRAGNYAYVWRERVAFRLLGNAGARSGEGRYAYYIDVEDLGSLYAELEPRLRALPAGSVEGPVDRDYGQRELLVRAPDGNLIVFGQEIG